MATNSFFSKLKKLGNVEFRDAPIINSANKNLTIEEIREKIVKTLNENKAVFNGQYKGTDKVNPNYKKLEDGTYQFSIKYGIRSLKGVMDGATYLSGLKDAQMVEAFNASINLVSSGLCDDAIEVAKQANKEMRGKGKKKTEEV